MKKLLLLLVLLFSFSISYAQEETVQIKKSELTLDQLKSLELQETEKKIESYSKMAGFGKEIGIAINDGLNAVVDVSQKFSTTDVGKFTIMIIGWKLLYKDLVRIFLGLFFIVVATWFTFLQYRKLVPHKIRTKGAWYQFWVYKEYQIVKPDDFDGIEFVKVLLILFLMGSFGITYAIMFG